MILIKIVNNISYLCQCEGENLVISNWQHIIELTFWMYIFVSKAVFQTFLVYIKWK